MAADANLKNLRTMMEEAAKSIVKGETEATKAEYQAQFEKLSADFDAEMDALKTKFVALDSHLRTTPEPKSAKRAAGSAITEFVKTGNPSKDALTKADVYVRFDAPAAGNLLMADDLAAEINRKILEISPVLQVVDVQTSNSAQFDAPVQTDNLDAYWEGEDEETDLSKDAFKLVKITPFELRARVGYTQAMLEDSAYDLEGYTFRSIEDKMAQKIGTAVLSGDGVGKPAGMNAGLDSVNSLGLTLAWNDLVNLYGSIKTGYLGADPGSVGWMFTRLTRNAIRVLALTNGNAYTWEPNGKEGFSDFLLGHRIFIAAEGDLASATTAGAFTSGQVGVLFGNFRRAYTVARRPQMHIIRDIYTGSARFRVFLNVMQRIDGRVTNSEAAKRLVAAGS